MPCLEVAAVVAVWLHHDGHVLHDGEAVAFESDALHGVVRDESQLADTHLPKDLCAYSVLSLVGAEAEVYVGVHRVVALLLELIGCYFVHESDASTFLAEVDDESFAFLLDHLHRLV